MQKLINTLVTGVILAIKGRVLDSGELAIDDICVPGLSLYPIPGIVPSTIPPPLYQPVNTSTTLSSTTSASNTHKKPVYICLLSGLAVGNRSSTTSFAAHPLALQLLLDYITGMNGSNDEVTYNTASIARVIIAGGLISKPTLTTMEKNNKSTSTASTNIGHFPSSNTQSFFVDRNITAAEAESAAIPLKEADQWLSQLCSTLPVDIMPGEGEPSTFALPQQPLHSVLFPHSSRFSSLSSVTNPYSVQVNNLRILGHSGQPIDDIARYTSLSELTVPGDEFGLRNIDPNNQSTNNNDDEIMDDGNTGLLKSSTSHTKLTTATTTTTSSSSSSSAAMEEEYEGNLESSTINEQEIAAVLSSTSNDKTLEMQAGTGAGSGFEIREKAGAGGEDIIASLNPMNILVNTLYWRHMAPTAPDTLSCHPS